jgi:hypothetical protein
MVVATPGSVATALRSGHLTSTTLAASLQMLILDEADLLLSYGYEEDLQLLAPQVPRSCQCVLMSATSSEDVERLQKLVLHSPAVLNLLDLGASLAAGSGTAQEILHFELQVGLWGLAASCACAERAMEAMAVVQPCTSNPSPAAACSSTSAQVVRAASDLLQVQHLMRVRPGRAVQHQHQHVHCCPPA